MYSIMFFAKFFFAPAHVSFNRSKKAALLIGRRSVLANCCFRHNPPPLAMNVNRCKDFDSNNPLLIYNECESFQNSQFTILHPWQ